MAELKVLENLKKVGCFCRCSYVRTFKVPEYGRKNVIRSFAKSQLQKVVYETIPGHKYSRYKYQNRWFDLDFLEDMGFDYGVSIGQIGFFTGDYVEDTSHPKTKFFWLKITPLYCDVKGDDGLIHRVTEAWVRSIDVNPDVTADLIAIKKAEEDASNNNNKSKAIWWVSAAVIAIKALM